MSTIKIIEPKTQEQVDTQFLFACMAGKLNSVVNLLTSQERNFHPDLQRQESGLKMACQHNNEDIIKYLIIDFNMPISDEIKKWLRGENQDDTFYCGVLRLLEKRELHEKLTESLNCPTHQQTKTKTKPKAKL